MKAQIVACILAICLLFSMVSADNNQIAQATNTCKNLKSVGLVSVNAANCIQILSGDNFNIASILKNVGRKLEGGSDNNQVAQATNLCKNLKAVGLLAGANAGNCVQVASGDNFNILSILQNVGRKLQGGSDNNQIAQATNLCKNLKAVGLVAGANAANCVQVASGDNFNILSILQNVGRKMLDNNQIAQATNFCKNLKSVGLLAGANAGNCVQIASGDNFNIASILAGVGK